MSLFTSTRPEDGDHMPVTMRKILQQLRNTLSVSITNPTGEVGVLGEVETLTHEHAHVHDGSSFLASDMQSLGNNTSYRYSITVPAGDQVAHLFWRVSTTSEFYIELYESPTNVSGGSPLTGLNRNRNSSNGPLLAIMSGVSVVADGTRLLAERVGSGTIGIRVGGQSQQVEEWVLKPGTTYIFHVRCVTAGSVATQIQWYQTDLATYE